MDNKPRSAATFLMGFALLGICGFAAPGDVELFTNTGFEEGLKGWRALNMSKACQFEVDKKVKKGGKRSLRIERGVGARPDFLKQFVDLESDGGRLTFEAHVRVDKPGDVRVTLLFSDADGTGVLNQEIESLGPTRKKWKKIGGEFEVPEGTKNVGVNFWFREEGIVWVDGVSLKWDAPKERKARGRELALVNGDFGKGLDGWEGVDVERSGIKAKHDRRVGKGSLKLVGEGGRLFPLGGVETQVARTNREKRATLAFLARVEEGARATVALQALGAGGGLLASKAVLVRPGSKEMDTFRLELELPKGTESVAVVALAGGNGAAWFDGFVLGGK